jgi:WD40 repeat protein
MSLAKAQDAAIFDSPEILQIGNGTLSDIDWRPDGDALAVGTSQTLWLLSPELDRQFQVEMTDAKVIRWNPDGRLVAVGQGNGVVEIRDGSTWEVISSFQISPTAIENLQWSPIENQIAVVGNSDNSVMVWDVASGDQRYKLGDESQDDVAAFDWSPDGSRLVVSYRNGMIRIWNILTQQIDLEFTEHPAFVDSVTWQPNGDLIASSGVEAGNSGTLTNTAILVWNSLSGEVVQRFLTDQWSNTSPIAWSPDGSLLAGTSQAGSSTVRFEFSSQIRIWNVVTGEMVHEWNVLDDNQIVQLLWDSSGEFLAYRKSLRRQNGMTRFCGEEYVGTIRIADNRQLTFQLAGHSTEIAAIEWSPDGQRLASGGLDTTIRIWDVSNGNETAALEGHRCRIEVLKWNPVTPLLASYATDNTVRIWDVTNNTALFQEEFDLWAIIPTSQMLAWSPTGTALAGVTNEGQVRIWDVVNRLSVYDELIPLPDAGAVFAVFQWTDDVPLLAIASLPSSQVEIWRLSSPPTFLRSLEAFTGYVETAIWSPEGSRLAVYSSDNKVSVWNVATGTMLYSLDTSDRVPQVRWNSSGDRLLINQNLYEATNGTFLGTFGHQAALLSWNPHEGSLAGVAPDNLIRIWDISDFP